MMNKKRMIAFWEAESTFIPFSKALEKIGMRTGG